MSCFFGSRSNLEIAFVAPNYSPNNITMHIRANRSDAGTRGGADVNDCRIERRSALHAEGHLLDPKYQLPESK